MKLRKIKATEKKEKWAKSRGDKLVGAPLKPSRKAEALYRKVLQKAVIRMRNEYEKTITRELKPAQKKAAQDSSVSSMGSAFGFLNKKWAGVFSRLANKVVGDVIKNVCDDSQKSLNSSLKELSGLSIKTPDLPESMIAEIQKATRVNVSLIKSIQSQYHEKVFMSVMSEIGDASEIKGVAEKLVSKTYFIGESVSDRAALIARDQTSKLTSAVNISRMKSSGIKEAIWRHSGGSRNPRRLHVRYDGQVFNLDEPPIIDEKTKERGWPGDAINCRCFLVPIMTFRDD